MKLNLQSLFGLHGHSCTHWLRSRTPPLPFPSHLGSYTRALLVSQDRRHVFVTPCYQVLHSNRYWDTFCENQCCGSGIRCFFDPGIRNRFFPDPGSRITNPYFWELSDNFLNKKFYNSLKIGQNFFLQHFKNKIIFNYVKFVATKKGMAISFFSPLSFAAVFGSGIRDG